MPPSMEGEMREVAQAPGNSVPLEEPRPGKHMVWGKRRMKEHRESQRKRWRRKRV